MLFRSSEVLGQGVHGVDGWEVSFDYVETTDFVLENGNRELSREMSF